MYYPSSTTKTQCWSYGCYEIYILDVENVYDCYTTRWKIGEVLSGK